MNSGAGGNGQSSGGNGSGSKTDTQQPAAEQPITPSGPISPSQVPISSAGPPASQPAQQAQPTNTRSFTPPIRPGYDGGAQTSISTIGLSTLFFIFVAFFYIA
jgi:hypothetical protein